MVAKPGTAKDGLHQELNTVLATVEGKIDKATAQKVKQAMDRLLEQDNKFNREILANAVDELLIIGDAKELQKEEIKTMLSFFESLREFLSKGLKNLYEYDNLLKEEQRKVKARIEDIQEAHKRQLGR